MVWCVPPPPPQLDKIIIDFSPQIILDMREGLAVVNFCLLKKQQTAGVFEKFDNQPIKFVWAK